jgi:hypothetical protein
MSEIVRITLNIGLGQRLVLSKMQRLRAGQKTNENLQGAQNPNLPFKAFQTQVILLLKIQHVPISLKLEWWTSP